MWLLNLLFLSAVLWFLILPFVRHKTTWVLRRPMSMVTLWKQMVDDTIKDDTSLCGEGVEKMLGVSHELPTGTRMIVTVSRFPYAGMTRKFRLRGYGFMAVNLLTPDQQVEYLWADRLRVLKGPLSIYRTLYVKTEIILPNAVQEKEGHRAEAIPFEHGAAAC